ncbi:MAG: 4Fe-4S binding protein [Finegoldia sp.]|nr:4Fe-4S binding protein [Finegoldia sp.]
MIRQIINIDEEKCNGCGLCATACHEGAIDIIDGKAKLVRENFCDGFGDCLPACPTGAISFETRQAPDYDEAAVRKAKEEKESLAKAMTLEEVMDIEDENEKRQLMELKLKEAEASNGSFTCPGSRAMKINIREEAEDLKVRENKSSVEDIRPVSQLNQWPCQIKLVPTIAPFFDRAKLLIAADCTAYAYANMHEDFMKGKITLIGCPKLDACDYTDKLTEIIANNDIKSLTIVRMEVPCCGGLQLAAENALKNSGKFIPWQVVTISRDGRIIE